MINISIVITIIKLIVLLGFLIIIHEGGHFLVAKLCNVKVKEFSIGFGPKIFKFQGKETLYTIRAIPLGGFVNLEGEDEDSSDERSFSNVSIVKRILIVVAGATVNIVFGLLVYLFIFDMYITWDFILSLGDSLAQLFTGKIGLDQMVGPVGIGTIVSKTTGIMEFLSLTAVISVSLGITNLLPIPALDGGKLVLLIVEAIRKKPLNRETENKIQLIGFSCIIMLSLIVMYQDITRIIA